MIVTVDVLLYRSFPLIRAMVQAHVANQMFTEVSTRKPTENWSIIAHSLGTAVAHDTLHRWATQLICGAGKLDANARPSLLLMLANVSRILQSDVDVLG